MHDRRDPFLGAGTPPPVVRLGIMAKMMAGIFAFMGLIFLVCAAAIGGPYFGHSGLVDGVVVAMQGDHPVVQYTVDGSSYQHETSIHGSQFAVGQQLKLCYQPANPATAQTCDARTVGVVFGAVGAASVVVALIAIGWAIWRRSRVRVAVTNGQLITATVVGTRVNRQVHVGNTVLWYVMCAWDKPATGRRLEFRSEPVWSVSDPMPAMEDAGMDTLPVYIDRAGAEKIYYVDTRPVEDLLKHHI